MSLKKPGTRICELSGIRLGDEIVARVEYGMSGGTHLPPLKGRVVYIHPAGRFYTLEFAFEKGSFRQAYPLAGFLGGLPGDEPESRTEDIGARRRYAPNL